MINPNKTFDHTATATEDRQYWILKSLFSPVRLGEAKQKKARKMSGTMFRGTNVEQDCRWGRTEKKLLKTMEKNGTFAAILETKVDLKKVNIDIMSKWVTERIVQLFGFEDEIVINLIINMLNSPKV
jgi:hypothetical protein